MNISLSPTQMPDQFFRRFSASLHRRKTGWAAPKGTRHVIRRLVGMPTGLKDYRFSKAVMQQMREEHKREVQRGFDSAPAEFSVPSFNLTSTPK